MATVYVINILMLYLVSASQKVNVYSLQLSKKTISENNRMEMWHENHGTGQFA